MEFKVYTKANALGSFGAGRTTEPRISFGKSGVIRLNKALVAHLNVEQGDGIQIAQDPKNPEDWYLSVHENGLPLRVTKAEKDFGALQIQSSLITTDVRAALDKDGTVSCLVGKEADELGWYPIITASAK